MFAIAAMSLNRSIGFDGRLPWSRIKEDFANFKRLTEHKEIVVGYKTWLSLPTLKNRCIFILTRKITGRQIAHTSFEDNSVAFYVDLNNLPETAIVCGGAQIYELLLPRCSHLYLTLVKKEYKGDTFMPEFENMFVEKEMLLDNELITISRYDANEITFKTAKL